MATNSLQARDSDLRVRFKEIPKTAEGGCHARIWLPSAGTGKDLAVAIMYHGGAFTFGDDLDVPGPEVDYLNRHGVVVVSLQYRLAPHVRFNEQSEDLVDGYQWVIESLVRHIPGAERVQGCVVSGWSAGATSTCLATAGAAQRGLATPKAIMCTYGLYDTNKANITSDGFPTIQEKDLLERVLAEPCLTGIPHRPPSETPSARRSWMLQVGYILGYLSILMLPLGLIPVLSTHLFPFTNPSCPAQSHSAALAYNEGQMLNPHQHFANGTLNNFLNGDHPDPLPRTYMPSALVTPQWPPTYILVATKDALIDPQQSYDFIDTLRSAGVEVQYGEADMPHGASEVEWTGSDEAKRDYERWFEGAIRPGLDFMIARLRA